MLTLKSYLAVRLRRKIDPNEDGPRNTKSPSWMQQKLSSMDALKGDNFSIIRFISFIWFMSEVSFLVLPTAIPGVQLVWQLLFAGVFSFTSQFL